MDITLTDEEVRLLLDKLGRDLALRLRVREYWQEQGWDEYEGWSIEIRQLEEVVRKLQEAVDS